MNYEDLRRVSQVRIGRSEITQNLYRAEDAAQRAVKVAASELAKVVSNLTAMGAEDRDFLALELAFMLDYFGGAGAQAARLIVERYGDEDSDSREQDDAAKNAAASKMPKPDPDRTLAFLGELHSHSVYKINWLCERLESCGFHVEKVLQTKGITVNGIWMRPDVSELGDSGIASCAVLDTAFRVFTGQTPRSEAIGRGFRFDDVLGQLKQSLAEKGPNQNL
jgi:hypothetical protein